MILVKFIKEVTDSLENSDLNKDMFDHASKKCHAYKNVFLSIQNSEMFIKLLRSVNLETKVSHFHP